MQEVSEVFIVIFIVRGMIHMMVIGILINELFNPERKNKLEVFWLLLIGLIGSIFLGISDYGIFKGGLSNFLVLIIIFSFVSSLGLFVAFVIKNFKFINKILVFLAIVTGFIILIIVLLDRAGFFSSITLSMIGASLILVIIGSFIYIDFLIKTSKGE